MKGSRIQFPQELVDHTIDHLHDDLLTLCNCSLVCHSWTPPSRLHLFSTIRLREPSRHNSDNPLHKPCQRLYRFLTDSPYIIPYIKGLIICEGSKLSGFSSTSWIPTEGTLPPLLVKLTHLQRLELHATGPVTWNTLPNNLRDAIRALFCYSSLAYVQFNSWIFPKIADFASLLSACLTLKGLALRLCTIGSADMDTFLESERETDRGCTQRAQLEFLTVDYMDLTHLAGWLISPQATVDISLRELRVAYSNDTLPIQKLLQAVDSIEHCHLNPRGRPAGSLDISNNSKLRFIRLTLDGGVDAITWATTLFSSITPSNRIERVAIECHIDVDNFSGWGDLDYVLSRPELCALRQVDVGIAAIYVLKVEKGLPMLRTRGILRVHDLRNNQLWNSMSPLIHMYDEA